MTIEEASKCWNRTTDTIKKWINEDRFPYTVENGIIVIPDIERPHIIRKDMRVNDKKVRDHIINATKKLEYIDAKTFMGKVKEDKFAGYMDALEEDGELLRINGWKDNKSNRGYIYNGSKKKSEQKNALKMKKAERPLNLTGSVGLNVSL